MEIRLEFPRIVDRNQDRGACVESALKVAISALERFSTGYIFERVVPRVC